MHDLRLQIEVLHQALLDIGRNVTLAIVFGCSVIAYSIWTQRRIPDVSEPTIITNHASGATSVTTGDGTYSSPSAAEPPPPSTEQPPPSA